MPPLRIDIRFPPDATGEYSSPAKRIPEPLLHAPEPPQLLPYHPGRGSVAEKKNRRCISATEDVDQLFHEIDGEPGSYRCAYCEAKLRE